MKKIVLASALVLPLVFPGTVGAQQSPGSQPSSHSTSQPAGAVAPEAPPSAADGILDRVFTGQRKQRVFAVQVLLDRSRHSPGVIDGLMGGNTRRAIRAFRRASDLPAGTQIDDRLIEALQQKQGDGLFESYTIGKDDVDGPFVDIPSGFADLAQLDNLAFQRPSELLAEKFHMDEGFLKTLNPGVDFGKAGTKILVVKKDDGVLDADIGRIEIDKAKKSVFVLGKDGALVASYPATIGSSEFPSPSGSMKVAAIAYEPKYYFQPDDQEWGPDEKLTIAAGPNNPIGGTWIDLGENGYGIHGSPDPHMVGKRQSHGCVRLTNWDAAQLAKAVSAGVPVEFR